MGSVRAWRALGLALVVLAVGIRVWNALHYPPDQGFDASGNWRYIYRLSEDWQLPDPRAGWSTVDPPLYFVVGAVIWEMCESLGNRELVVRAIPLASAAFGLGVAALAFSLIRRTDPGNELRAWLAAGLVLYLPAQIQISAMVNEEVLLALLLAISLWGLATEPPAVKSNGGRLRRTVCVGLAAGLALLTKLTGALAPLVAVLTYAVEGWRTRAWQPALRAVAIVASLTLLTGGAYLIRNLVQFGFIQPVGLAAHAQMLEMPPGERSLSDYVSFPAATWTDPQLLNPDLLESVWGSTFVTLWFDGHRFFLPTDDPLVTRLGTATLLLALLPTLAFGIGMVRGVRRIASGAGRPDLPLVLMTGFALAGYAYYTWRNPWFAVVKGTSLSAVTLPFAFYASEVLSPWLRRRGARSAALLAMLTGLVVCSVIGTTFNVAFHKTEVSGLSWQLESTTPGSDLPTRP